MDALILAFDVGGSHIGAAILSTSTMTLVANRNVSVSHSDGPDQIFGAFRYLADALHVESGSIIGVAVSVPSPFDYQSGISLMKHKYARLCGLNIRLALSEWLGCDPNSIHFLNDAAAFLLGELSQGAARGAKRAIGITLGTGVGSAFSRDGEIILNGHGVPPQGEIWNYPYRDGTVEDAVSTRAVQRLYQQRTGTLTDVREIASLSAVEALARDTFAAFGSELGNVLRLTCVPFAPNLIVLGGGISRAASLFLPATQTEIADLPIKLCLSSLSDHASVIGAAVSWMKSHAPEWLLQSRFENVADGG